MNLFCFVCFKLNLSLFFSHPLCRSKETDILVKLNSSQQKQGPPNLILTVTFSKANPFLCVYCYMKIGAIIFTKYVKVVKGDDSYAVHLQK